MQADPQAAGRSLRVAGVSEITPGIFIGEPVLSRGTVPAVVLTAVSLMQLKPQTNIQGLTNP